MSDNRVLTRMGARQLSEEELDKITGACCRNTHASQVPTGSSTDPDIGFDS